MTSQIYFCGALLWGYPGITRVVLNRFGRIPFLGFDRVGDWPDVWTTGIWTHWNGFGFDFWPRPNIGKFEATGAAGFKRYAQVPPSPNLQLWRMQARIWSSTRRTALA